MSFEVAADAYSQFMGRYARPLAPELADLAGIGAGQRVLDVGCGPGALTDELVGRVGATWVSAVDPSQPFVDALARSQPAVDVRLAAAEALPYDDGAFDASLAQLVVQFMTDPVAGVGEMGRVTRSGGVVAACVWDHGPGGRGPLSTFWTAARELDPDSTDESEQVGARRGDLGRLFADAGFSVVEERELIVHVHHPTFEEWWQPFTFGVGTAGSYVSTLDDDHVVALVARARELLPTPPFDVDAVAWSARGRVLPR